MDSFTLLEILAIALVFTAYWRLFEKAGKPGWAAVVPIYNVIVLLDLVKRPRWWAIFFFLPLANIVVSIVVHIELARCFGKTPLFGLGMALFPVIFVSILGFGEASYNPDALGS